MFRLVVVSCLLGLSLGASIPTRNKKFPRNLKPIFPSGRIVGGHDTAIEEVPWQVALENNQLAFCGGSILSETAVLTAGHCVEGLYPRDINVYYGSAWHQGPLGRRFDGHGYVVETKEIIRHPKFNYTTADYDVAVLILASPIGLSSKAQPIKPADNEPEADTSATVAGWGILHEGDQWWEVPTNLQSVVVPIVNRTTCEEIYEFINPITSRMICAGEAGKDSCQGDSGGAVAVNGTVVGIVSWAYGCARNGFPGVFTNVADKEIRDFIRENAGV